jgi:uncharacterized protein (DUF1330 family)
MSAFLVVQIRVHDPVWVADYLANVPRILRGFGGEYFAVSGPVAQFEGTVPPPHQVALFTFPSLQAIEEFMACDEYRPFKESRLAGATATIVGFETRS